LSKVISRLYPEFELGGFTRDSHWMIFFSRVNALVREDMTVLDLGAGRGEWMDREGYRSRLANLQAKCARLIGADVDKAVLENQHVDQAMLVASDGLIALEDSSVDMVVSWAVFEHIQNPEQLESELYRILKPGGVICAWTPNKFSYLGIAARIIPSRYHYKVLKLIGQAGKEGQREERDVFPTYYRLNSARSLNRIFSPARYRNHSYRWAGPPSYHGNMLVIALLWQFWNWILPRGFTSAWHIFIRKTA
jgi:ubiquinone/menaquinone biosynthesis C-methylase UbiE